MEGLTNTTILWRGGGAGGSVNSGYPPAKCTNLVAKAKNASIALTWNDPEDITIHGPVKVKWAKTVVVRKVGSCPLDENDGTVVVSSTVRNQYATNPFIDTGLTNQITYYYAAFSCSEDEVYNREIVSVSATPIPYKIMTVRIDLNNSNPATCGSYADDAVSMNSGKIVPAWDKFFGYKPCLFKNGSVIGYLNPNDYTKFENGEPADITSGNAGDVMVEFPRRGLKISKSGKILTISMTDDPDNPDFTYYAHNRGEMQKKFFYVGSYLCYLSNTNTLRSISGMRPTVSKNIEDYRTYVKKLGVGYEVVSFYQFVFLQCMYLLQYKGHLNSQLAHGHGMTQSNNDWDYVGSTDKNGMMYGTSSDKDHIKIFGIEDLWGHLACILNGLVIEANGNIRTTTDNFSNLAAYKSIGSWQYYDSGFINNVIGTNELGFMPISFNGSNTTYFCDHCHIFSNQSHDRIFTIGNKWYNGAAIDSGIFRIENDIVDDVSIYVSTRIMYL